MFSVSSPAQFFRPGSSSQLYIHVWDYFLAISKKEGKIPSPEPSFPSPACPVPDPCPILPQKQTKTPLVSHGPIPPFGAVFPLSIPETSIVILTHRPTPTSPTNPRKTSPSDPDAPSLAPYSSQPGNVASGKKRPIATYVPYLAPATTLEFSPALRCTEMFPCPPSQVRPHFAWFLRFGPNTTYGSSVSEGVPSWIRVVFLASGSDILPRV